MRTAWVLRLGTLSVFLCLGASLSYWSLRWPSDASAPSPTVLAQGADDLLAPDPATLSRLLGSGQASAAPASGDDTTLRLVGVVARSHGAGTALIAASGLPQKSVAVGSEVQPGLVLQSVTPRSASLSSSMQAPTSLTLELPRSGH